MKGKVREKGIVQEKGRVRELKSRVTFSFTQPSTSRKVALHHTAELNFSLNT
jgi:hypothetical protein